MNSPALTPDGVDDPTACDPSVCPLCRQPNDCQLCISAPYKGPCWCVSAKIPDELLVRIEPEFRNKACICPACVAGFHEEQIGSSRAFLPEDYYHNEAGLIVLTAAYLQRRGYCCGRGCLHCPYTTRA